MDVNQPAVVTGTFSNMKFVMGCKVGQLIIEVPLERVPDVLSKLGTPMPDRNIDVAVALLDLKRDA